MRVEACESWDAAGNLTSTEAGGAGMKRDLDYMRQVLSDMEESDEWLFHLLPAQGRPLSVDSKREYYIRLLADQGLIKAESPGIYRMTARGHDFLDHTRDETIWEKTKSAAAQAKDFSVSFLMEVAKGYVRSKLRDITGLDL